jgi:diguanylate cyclase (GGDEF)-like protein/PAS domain S-box-containing protein
MSTTQSARFNLTRYRAALLIVLLLAAMTLSGLSDWLRETILDARFRVVTRPASGTVALVEIDPRSIEAIGHWPWPRSIHAQIISALDEAKATSIVFDIDFSARSTDPEDQAFAAALQAAGGSIILPAFRQRLSERGKAASLYINRPLPAFTKHTWLGLVNVAPDNDGVIRHYPFGAVIEGEFIPSFGALMANRHDPSATPFRIDYGIQASSVPNVSAIALLRRDEAALAAVRGKTVIISGTAAELGDRFTVPNGRIIPGSMVQALAAESMLQARDLRVTSPTASVLLLATLMLLAALVGRRAPLGQRIVAIMVLAGAAEASGMVLQFYHPVAPDTSLVIIGAAAYIIASAIDEIDLRGLLRLIAERRFQRIAMSLGDGLICADANGRLTMWNPGAGAIFGYGESDRIGATFESLLAPEDRGAGSSPFALSKVPVSRLQQPGGYIVDLIGQRKNGELFDLECSLSAWETPDGTQFGAVLRDISQRKRHQERIRYLAERDPITGLANRNTLLTTLEDELGHGPATLVLMSIDRYKQISTFHGVSFADALAVGVARRIERLEDEARLVARIAGDEFAVVIRRDTDNAIKFAQLVIADFAQQPVDIGDRSRRITVSIGVAAGASVGTAEEWLGNGQFALSAAKSSLGSPAIYNPEMREGIARREMLENELRLALANGDFELFYQPQIELRSRAIIGAEALIRWRHAERGYVSPGEFMPVVNSSYLSESVAAWVLETGIRQAAHWERLGHAIRVGINLSQSQFTTGDLVSDVARLLAETGASPELVELEITEDIILEGASNTQQTLSELRALGVKIAFDDFGTGYGSLTYLKAFPLDTIKIDQSFVKTLVPGSDDAAIVTATINLGHALGLSVIAEGIETEEVAQLLAHKGCDEGQGYLISRPVPAEAFLGLLDGRFNSAA